MSRKRWVFVAAAALVAVVVFVAPAAGQGKATTATLGWSRALGEPTITYYNFGSLGTGARVSRLFRLGSSSLTKSGKLAITLTGSPAFSIASDRCTDTSIGQNLACWVAVVYAPRVTQTRDSATLTATGQQGEVARLSLVGSRARYVYWVDNGTCGLCHGGTVNKVPIGGGTVTTLARVPGGRWPASVAVDGTYVYWVSPSSSGAHGTVSKVPIGGGSVTTLAGAQGYPYSVAVDRTHVYWVNWLSGEVNKVPLGGGTVTTLANEGRPAYSIAVDSTNVYWDNDYSLGGGELNKVPLGGGKVTKLVGGGSQFGSVAVDGAHVFFTHHDGTVNQLPARGCCGMTVLARGQLSTSVAVDGTHVYWTSNTYFNPGGSGSPGWIGTVYSVPIGGGSVTTLGSARGGALAVAVDGTNVYWLAGGVGVRYGTVNMVPVGGGKVTVLATNQESPVSLAVGP